jgi:hypothetical protein
MAHSSPRLHLLGPILNFVQHPGATPLDAAHQAGLTFVAMDAGAYADFTGGRPTGEWVVAREVQANLPQLQPWPKTGWRFKDEAAARKAYEEMRSHALSRLPSLRPHDDRGPERQLNDPASAWGEAFVLNGEEVLYLSCDRATEARILKMLTDRLGPYKTRGAQPATYAAYNSQTAPHLVAIGTGASGLAEHVVVAFSPGNEQGLIAAGLPRSVRETDLKPFRIDVASGVLVVAWGRIDGAAMLGRPSGRDPASAMLEQLGNHVAGPLPTPLDAAASGPLAWAIRVQPGSYHVALRFLDTSQGISSMALSHTEAAPLWADMAPASSAPRAPAFDQQAQVQAAQRAQAQIAAGAGGDADPVVFPGQPLARLSDYVRMMKGMQTGDMHGALRNAGLDMMSYGRVAQAWGAKLASDPGLTAKFAAMMGS